MEKRNVAVLFGSRSVEHEVSIVTAVQLMQNINPNRYQVYPIYIDSKGVWYTGDALREISFYRDPDYRKLTRVYLEPVSHEHTLWGIKKGLTGEKRVPLCTLDVAIPAFHGMNGEDGTVQGLLELMDLPYTSASVLGSVVGMDKIAMRQVFAAAGFPIVPYTWGVREEFRRDAEGFCARIEAALPYPIFVKPANLGSSIGISCAQDRAGLMTALEVAFHYDRRVVAEQAVPEPLEINCAALGWGETVQPSLCEQPATWNEFLDFDKKYLSADGGKKGMAGMSRQIPAPIDADLTARIQTLAVDCFRALDCKGVCRVDFIIDQTQNKLYVNEINTIPGSFAFYLFEPMGIPYPKLIDRLIECALQAHKAKEENSYAFRSAILAQAEQGLGKLGGK